MNTFSTNNTLKTLEKFYTDKKFDQGIDYLLDHKNELPIAKFHYYFGSFELKQGNLAVGKYHLKLAIKSGFIQKDIFHNLNVVNAQPQIKEVQSTLPWKDNLLYQSLNIHSNFYIILSLLLVCTVLFLYWREWIVKKVILSVALLLCLVPVLTKFIWLDQYKFAVVLKNTAILEGPSVLYEKSGELPAGVTIIMGRTYNGKVFIKAPDKYSGWIKKENLGIL